MTSSRRTIVIGTRKSKLALWQTEFVKKSLEKRYSELCLEIKKISTRGDQSQAKNEPLPQIGGKGLFTAELEQELESKGIDLAVHSLKDLPTEMESIFTLGAVCQRAAAADVLISRGDVPFSELSRGAVIGTSSVRRAAQMKNLRQDLQTECIRGNVETRIRKLHEGNYNYDAIVLAQAGLERLNLGDAISYVFTHKEMLPAPGQGAMAVQCRANDAELLDILSEVNHLPTRAEVTAERSFLSTLDAGCNTPVACRAEFKSNRLVFAGRCLAPDGSRALEVQGEAEANEACILGKEMAALAIEKGYREFLCPS